MPAECGGVDTAEERLLEPGQRGRLVVAIVILGCLALLCAVDVGTALHAWTETQDSLDHWRARQAEEAAEGSEARPGFDSPAVRIRRLEEDLDAFPERLFAAGGMFLFSSALVLLGVRRLRR